MRLLDRYVLRELLVPFGSCLGAILVFWITFDVFTELENFQRHHLTAVEIARYYLCKSPEFMVFPIVPVAWLCGLLYTLANHARHQELTAMRTAGVSLWRVALPYLGVGLLLSLGLFAINELWVPQAVQRADEILEAHEPAAQQAAGQGPWETKLGFHNTREKRIWLIEAFNTQTHEMLGPHVEWDRAAGGYLSLKAERAWWADGCWVFTNVEQFFYPAGRGTIPVPEQNDLLVMREFRERPEEIQSEIKISQMESLKAIRRAQLSVREILHYKRLHRDTSKLAVLDTKLHGRLAQPWTCLVIVLMALPFGAATGRRNVFVGVASSIVICFGYFVLLQLALALGSSGLVVPWVAAWSPTVVFGGLGFYLTWRAR